jgi:uncharacterized protein YndB with AHSA1/START domain
MAAVTMSVVVARPAEDVFSVLTHVELASTWSSAIAEELITPGPIRVGSRRRAIVPGFGGRTLENVMELTELEPNRRLAMRGVSGFPVPVRISIDLTPLRDGTMVTWVAHVEPRGLWRWSGPLIGVVYKALFAKDLRRLKAMMETGAL